MNKIIKVEELKLGDEIIIASGSKIKYLKLLKVPIISNKRGWKKVEDAQGYFTWDRDALLYKATLCSTCVEEKTFKYKPHRQGSPDIYKNYKEYIFEMDITKHNKRVSINLNDKNILLVKREEEVKENEVNIVKPLKIGIYG